MKPRCALCVALGLAALAAPVSAAKPPLPAGEPAATIDLATAHGVALVRGAWRYSDARIVEREHRAPDADGQPTGAPLRTWDVAPRAGRAEFDDAGWETLDPASLARRRSTGRLCFNWYRIRITVPERIGAFDPTGATVVFETVLDDYAEVWVDGELARGLGQRGGTVVAGWNAPNRLVVARGVRPGREIQLAVFGANGPLSDPPANFIWMRRATLEFFPGEPAGPYALEPEEVNVEIERAHPGLDALVPANPKLFKLAEGFQFIEGPLWLRDAKRLLFSDPDANRIYEYDPAGAGSLRVFREQSGYAGADVAAYRQPGSNGLALDPEGRLTIAEHGRHRITRVGRNGDADEILADRFEGRRLNSPNDLVWRSDGTLYFSDPPFGLPGLFGDPRRELPYSGVFAWRDGALRLVSRDLLGPNGLAFSPDERFLYVANWDPEKKIVMRYPVRADGSLADGAVFFDVTGAPGEEALDGLEVDARGNLYVSGPGGIWVISPDAVHLGTLRLPRLAANLAWGGDDAKTLYLTARSTLYAMPLRVAGIRP